MRTDIIVSLLVEEFDPICPVWQSAAMVLECSAARIGLLLCALRNQCSSRIMAAVGQCGGSNIHI